MELSPSSSANSSRKSTGIRSAKWCLWLPFVGILTIIALAVFAETFDTSSKTGNYTGFTLAALIFCLGLVLGIRALRIAKIEGRKAIFGRAVIGLGLNGFFLVVTLGLLGFQIYVQSMLATQQREEAASERKRQELVAMVNHTSNDFAEKVKAMMKRYPDSGMALTNPPVLDFASVKSREDLNTPEAVVKEYIAACRDLQNLATNGPKLYRQQLETAQLPARTIDAYVKIYTKSFRSSNRGDPAIREAEVRYAEAMLKILVFVDGEWDALTYDAGKQRFVFKNTSQSAEYHRLSEEYYKALKEYRDLQLAHPPAKAGN